ncbi:MAG: CocE/NonD family hydrolase [Alphaproteobacteria bacterium]|nr:CocE/NonD family hydrolase [Alphaproteobacteria bacterium]
MAVNRPPVHDTPLVWIPLRTGERLAARLWLPEGADAAPVPAIVEYIPYRRGDYTAVRDRANHGYLAGHGYACLRIDVRGTGDSDGIHHEQWSDDYDRDALDAFAWIAAQPWSDGSIGMIGLSWGGNTGLRMASLAPPALKAVIAISASDDRYSNKFLGGALLLNSVVWSYTMTAQNSRPPDPASVGEAWRQQWLDRLANAPWYIERWLAHQRHDAYWASGSVVARYGNFGCPVYSVGGQADPGYLATVPALMAGLFVPTKGLMGPWAHKKPWEAMPGPAVNFLDEARRWFDRWLKGVENGIEREPALRSWMQDWQQPAGYVATRVGRWVEEPTWPSPYVAMRSFYLNANGLADVVGREGEYIIASPQSLGSVAGEWMPWLAFGEQAELAQNQREDDGRSVAFDSNLLVAPIELLGEPIAYLNLASDKPVANLVVRLCDVAPDGSSARIAYGALNLTRREGLANPMPLTPGERYNVAVPLYPCGYRVAAGHRLRVALSTAYWPVIWPAPEPVSLTLYGGRIELPVRAPRPEAEAAMRAWGPVATAPAMARTVLEPAKVSRRTIRDLATGRVELIHRDDGGRYRIDDYGIEVAARTERRLSIQDDDPISARVELDWSWTLRRGDWTARTLTRATVWCTATTFEFESSLEGFEGERRVFAKQSRNSIARDLM